MQVQTDFSTVLKRLAALEAQVAIRACLHRYMQICDHLNPHTNLNELMDLFDLDSTWEGIGERYQKTFGCYRSYDAIYAMFKRYTQQQSHFVMNAHFLSSEQIDVDETDAEGSWLMLQSSTFTDGRSHLNGAKLSVKFKQQPDGRWKIKHFQTENIFSRPVSHWNSDAVLPVPAQK